MDESIMDYSYPMALLPNVTYTDFEMMEIFRNMSMQGSSYGADTYKRDLLTYYVMGVGGMTVCCFGMIGNILSICVLTRRTMRSSTYSYLCALSVCDCLVLFFTAILLVNDLNKPAEGAKGFDNDPGMYPYLFPYVHPLVFSFQVTSVWLTLAFTVDRYIMICHPFKAEPFCTVSRARKVIGTIILVGIVFNIPKYFEYKTVTVITALPYMNRTQVACDLTDFGKSAVFRELYHSWFYVAFVCGVPFLTLAVLNAFLMRAVHKSRKKGQEINVAERKRNDTTIMLISVVVVFFICQMPALVSRTIWAFMDDTYKFKQLPFYTLNEIGNLLMIINSAINIVPYYFFGRRFRRQFWKLFCHCLLGYMRFQKLSRSYSATVLDNRRPSTHSNVSNNFICSNKENEHRLELQCYKANNLYVPTTCSKPNSTSYGSTGQDPVSSDSHQSTPVEANGGAGSFESLHKLTAEVNGNCLISKLKSPDSGSPNGRS